MEFIEAFYDGSGGKYHAQFAKLYNAVHFSKKKNSAGFESGKALLMHLDLAMLWKKTSSYLAGCESAATVSNLVHQFGSI
ncbi:hypothetical protein HYDPIDRAFT_112412 [Hydnomerulius pinastri MD-312]|uniref:Uncharacterized protein n=1 Tax=Hydnomerulius pinastri MD-312 TaxID=994086 RepID=A0A0C9VZQ0_9AGAM|nr:hypothetical protein HYDPIDRAFT_112412 [Hydnomerulius pinastri MD-312]